MSEYANPLPAALGSAVSKSPVWDRIVAVSVGVADVLIPIKKRKRVTPVALKYIFWFCSVIEANSKSEKVKEQQRKRKQEKKYLIIY